MEKSIKMDKFKSFLIIAIAFCSLNCTAQKISSFEAKNFYIVDTISIKNPIVLYQEGRNGFFVKDYDSHKDLKKISFNKILKDDDIYLDGEDSLSRFLESVEEIDKYPYPDYGNCKYKKESFTGIKGITYLKYKSNPKRFILGLVKISYYLNKTTTYGEKPSILSKYDKSLYYKIVFPLCE